MINPPWTSKGKSVAQLIEELQTFENQEMEVRISVDGGETSVPISLVAKSNLISVEPQPMKLVSSRKRGSGQGLQSSMA